MERVVTYAAGLYRFAYRCQCARIECGYNLEHIHHNGEWPGMTGWASIFQRAGAVQAASITTPVLLLKFPYSVSRLSRQATPRCPRLKQHRRGSATAGDLTRLRYSSHKRHHAGFNIGLAYLCPFQRLSFFESLKFGVFWCRLIAHVA